MLWHPDPPQGFSTSQGQVIIGRPIIPLIGAPQGVRAVPSDLLLDLFPGAAAAYSLRLLRISYMGPAIRVQRTSDDTIQDIGFLADGTLDIPALQSFVQNNDGLINIIYDQSRNGIDINVQGNDVRKPKIIIAGVLQTTPIGVVSLNFDGTDDVLVSTLSLPSPASQMFRFGVWQKTVLLNNPTNYNLDAPNQSVTRRTSAHAAFAVGTIFLDDGNTTTDRLQTGISFNDLLSHQYTFIKIAGTDNQKIKRDGIELIAKTQESTSTIVSKIAIGNFGDGGTNPAAMQWEEFVVYLIDVLSDVSAIESNQSSFYMFGNLITNAGEQLITNAGENLVYN